MKDDLIILELRGTWREMGYQYGRTLKAQIRRVLEWAQRLATEESDSFLLPKGLPMGIGFLDEFLEGMEDGAELTPSEVIRLIGVEVAYVPQVLDSLGKYAAGHCSALALSESKTKNGKMIYGRNYDWLASFKELGVVILTLHPSDSELTVTSINHPGCLYFTTGMNSNGLFVELNAGAFTSNEHDSTRLHNAWWLWQVATQAKNVPEALEILRNIPANSNVIVGLADKNTAVSCEWGIRTTAVIEGKQGVLAMSNHYVQDGWTNLPSMYDGGCASSYNRRKALLDLADAVQEHTADVDTMKRILDVPVEQGGAKWSGTLFQVVALPEEAIMHFHFTNQLEWTKIEVNRQHTYSESQKGRGFEQ